MNQPILPGIPRSSRQENSSELNDLFPPQNPAPKMLESETSIPLFSTRTFRLDRTHAITPPAAQHGAKSHKGKQNYCYQDITTLLDVVSDVLPLGSHMWSLVEKEFNLWTVEHGRPERDQDSLKGKFEKLVNTRKSTGDPHCPPDVRRAKHVSKKILRECSAVSVGDDEHEVQSDQELEKGNESNILDSTLAEMVSRRARIHKQLAPAKTIKKQKDPIVERMQNVAESIGQISSSLAPQFSENEIQKLVRDEVEKAAMETKKSIEELKEFISSIMKN